MKALYFAWVRERVGVGEEQIEVPSHVRTVDDVIGWLKSRGSNYAQAFEDAGAIRAALDRRHVGRDAMVAGAGEIAFFPPMTGG